MGIVTLRKELVQIKEHLTEVLSGLDPSENPQTKEMRIRMEGQLEVVTSIVRYINGDRIALTFYQ